MEIQEQLICFGLTRQEATIYITLLTEGELTGYEAAKLTGISRSNTYNALAGLVDKGAAYVIEGTVTKYTPVVPEEFCDNKIKKLEDMKKQMLKRLPSRRKETGGYITIKGDVHIYDKIRNIMNEAEERVYVFLSSYNLNIIQKELEELVKRNIKLVILTEKNYEMKGAIVYYADNVKNQVRLIADSKKVLTGDLTDQESAACLYSTNKNLVDVFKEMLKNEIKLIEIKNKY